MQSCLLPFLIHSSKPILLWFLIILLRELLIMFAYSWVLSSSYEYVAVLEELLLSFFFSFDIFNCFRCLGHPLNFSCEKSWLNLVMLIFTSINYMLLTKLTNYYVNFQVLQGLEAATSCVDDMDDWLGMFNVKLRHMREDIESVGKLLYGLLICRICFHPF